MQNIIVTSTCMLALASVALWVVWFTDRKQVFARDVALWYLGTVLAIISYAIWRVNPVGPMHRLGYLGLVVGWSIAHTFLLLGVRRFAVEDAPRPHLVYELAAGFISAYALMFFLDSSFKMMGAWSTLVTSLAGVYASIKLWNRGPFERAIGLLVLCAGSLPNLIVAIGGEAADTLFFSVSAFFRIALAFAFVFAALNRSASRSERLLQRFEQLSENSKQGIMVINTERFLYLNPAAVTMFGYSSQEAMLAANPWRGEHVDDGELTSVRFARAMQEDSGVIETEGIRPRQDGTQAFMRFTGWKVDWDGQPAMQVLVSDETDRHHAALELQRAEEEHRLSLIHNNAELERKVEERTRDLAQSNTSLVDANLRMEQTLETLRKTQIELVQREKLASLGRMVAGIAHELNTPIGVALTVGSTIGHQVRQLQIDVKAGQLKKSSFDEFLTASSEGANVLESALNKAHGLITKFRQVTKDNSNEPLSRFSATELLASLYKALQPSFDNSPISLVFELAEDIAMHSYPGHISQIITLLVDNARSHAFAGMESGKITVTLHLDGDNVFIAVADNGCGIPADIRDKVFDPLFTTRLGSSLGLGLNTVFTVATTKLAGTVQLQDVRPCGASFELRLRQTLI